MCVAAFMLLDTPQTNTQNVFSTVVCDDGDRIKCQKYPGERIRRKQASRLLCESKAKPFRYNWEIFNSKAWNFLFFQKF